MHDSIASVTPLIQVAELDQRLRAGAGLVVLDASFDLTDPSAGAAQFAREHIPGAQHVDLDRDLAAPKSGIDPRSPAFPGRHPLPERSVLAARMGGWGIQPATRVVVYDRGDGAFAARAWWLLRWMGHRTVQVLDGGLAAWKQAGLSLQTGSSAAVDAAAPYPAREPAMPTVQADALLDSGSPWQVLDARAAERFRGDVEPLDPVGGHIPGALNRPYKSNLQADGRFLPPQELRAQFDALGTEPPRIASQCGSGVTACHNLLAMEVAGLGGAALYPGSWSQWCADPARPVAKG